MRAITGLLLVGFVSLSVRTVTAQVVGTPPTEIAPALDGTAINGVDVATGGDGNLLYIWDNEISARYGSRILPSPDSAVLSRVYSPDGVPALSSDVRVDTTGRVSMWISAGRNGDGYLVAWTSTYPTVDYFDQLILGRRLDAAGRPVGGEVIIDASLGVNQDVPVVSGLIDGGSAVVWFQGGKLMGRVLSPSASPAGPRFTIFDGPYSWDGFGHDVAPLADGGFVVVWSSAHSSGISGMRLYEADGTPRTGILATSESFSPHVVAADPQGGFAAVGFTWIDGYKTVWLRCYGDDGASRSDEILVHQLSGDYYIADADAKFLPDGSLAVEWREYTRAGLGPIQAQAFDRRGTRLGAETTLPATQGMRLKASVTDDGRLANVWVAGSKIRLYLNAAWANFASFPNCDGDSCDPSPTPEPTKSWTATPTTIPSPIPTPTPAPLCGDGRVDQGEECDDENRVSGDGCDAACRKEACGNGRVEGLEACDDGNRKDGDGCQEDCTVTPMHDSVMQPEKAVDIVIPAGQSRVTKVVPLQVRNADEGERPGHNIQVVVEQGTCPEGTVASKPDFDPGAPGEQESTLVKGGTPATALLVLAAQRSSFPRLKHDVPLRCSLVVSAVTLLDGNVDPTPENNTIKLEVNVTTAGGEDDDESRVDATGLPEFFIDSARPLKVKIARGRAASVKTIPVGVGNGSSGLGLNRDLRVSALDGSCPAGTLGLIDFETATTGSQDGAAVRDGGRKRGKLTITAAAAAFQSRGRHRPARCVAQLIATSPQGDSGAASHLTELVLEVVDLND